MADPIREHLANVQIIRREDLDLGNAFSNQFTVGQRIGREVDEDEAEYSRRVRKTNLLSLAQEFAALKRIKADALPFDLHEEKYRGGGGGGGGEGGGGGGGGEGESDSGSDSDAVVTNKSPCSSSGEKRSDDLPKKTQSSMDNAAQPPNLNTLRRTVDTVVAPPSDPIIPEKTPPFPSAAVSPPNISVDSNSTGRSSSKSVPDVVVPCIPPITIASLTCSPVRFARAISTDIQLVKVPPETSRDSPSKKKLDESMTEEFDVYTMESSLPAMDWQHLEEQLLRAAEDEHNRRVGWAF